MMTFDAKRLFTTTALWILLAVVSSAPTIAPLMDKSWRFGLCGLLAVILCRPWRADQTMVRHTPSVAVPSIPMSLESLEAVRDTQLKG